jgi:hypothetical protein
VSSGVLALGDSGGILTLVAAPLIEVKIMPTDLTVVLVNQPGSDAAAMLALGRAGVNIDGITGSGCSGEGILHILVADAAAARAALEAAGQVIREEREVLVLPVQDRPGEGGAIMRRIADAGVNVDFIYLTTRGRLVVGAGDVEKARAAAGSA